MPRPARPPSPRELVVAAVVAWFRAFVFFHPADEIFANGIEKYPKLHYVRLRNTSPKHPVGAMFRDGAIPWAFATIVQPKALARLLYNVVLQFDPRFDELTLPWTVRSHSRSLERILDC